MENKITLFYNYYNQVDMLKKQVNLWNSYPNDILDNINILLIDDGSSNPAKNILHELDISKLPLSLYRINPDIYCNIGGTRNLACKLSDTEWILIIDMDIIISTWNLNIILKLSRNPQYIFKFNRIRPDNTFKIHPGVCFISTNTYWHVGGCDEDFVGNYGQTDVHFFYRANLKNINISLIEDIILEEDNDGTTKEINRTKEMLEPNKILFENKKRNGNWSTNYCRFNWIKEET
jgi:hypothetical protein